jgi:hypothetical protein
VVGVAVAVAAVAAVAGGVFALTGGDDEEKKDVEVVFGLSDGLPETLNTGSHYRAAFVVEWHGPVAERDGIVSVFASRTDGTEDAPEESWPIVCESEFDDVVSHSRLACQFEAPGPGPLALQLEVRSAITDEVIGEGLYTHNVVDPNAPPDEGS